MVIKGNFIIYILLNFLILQGCGLKKRSKVNTSFTIKGFAGTAFFGGGVMVWGKSENNRFFATSLQNEIGSQEFSIENGSS